MSKILLGLSVTLPAVTPLSTVIANQGDEPQFKMPCAEVVKLGLDKFINVFSEKTQDYSNYGQKQAYSYYVDCKRPANDERARQLPETRRQQVNAVRDALNEIGDASWSNAYLIAGGGTMYSLASVSAYAVREDVLAALIMAITFNHDSRSRRRANAAIRRARRALPSATRMPVLKHWDEASRPEHTAHYRTNVETIRKGFTQLEAIIRVLPDQAADLIAHRVEDELDAGLDD